VALSWLADNLYHQGTVYSASAAAAPFLGEALGILQSEHQITLLRLLGTLSQGHGYYDVHRTLSIVREMVEQSGDDPAAILAAERATVRDTTLAVFTQWGAIEGLLASPDRRARIAALFVLSRLAQNDATDPAPEDVPARYLGVRPGGVPKHSYATKLGQLADEKLPTTADPLERAAWVRALLQMGAFEHAALRPSAVASRGLLEKYLVAVSYGASQLGATPEVPEEVTAILAEVAEHHAGIDKILEDARWPWGGRPSDQILWLLTQLPDVAVDRIAASCTNLVAKNRSIAYQQPQILELVLGETRPQIPTDPCTLSPGRRALARALLADRDPADIRSFFWDETNPYASEACEKLGVPHDRELWVQWLGQEL
jgi:hypothetical protein